MLNLLSSMSEVATKAAEAAVNISGVQPLEIAMAVMTVIGAAFLFGFSLPLFFTTLKTRDTTHLSYLMWGIYVAATFFLGTPALVNSIKALAGGTSVSAQTKVSFIPLLVIGLANIVSWLTAVTLITLKAINCYKAKKAGMTEAEYCKLHNPVLKKQAKMLLEKEMQENPLEQQMEACDSICCQNDSCNCENEATNDSLCCSEKEDCRE